MFRVTFIFDPANTDGLNALIRKGEEGFATNKEALDFIMAFIPLAVQYNLKVLQANITEEK